MFPPISRGLLGLSFVALVTTLLPHVVDATSVDPNTLDACPGYKATNVQASGTKFTADLVLGGTPCNVFGNDIQKLSLIVEYETVNRIHLRITDASSARYEVPESVFPRPQAQYLQSFDAANIQFSYTASPFSFTIYRRSTQEILFSTVSHPIIFEPQYLRVKTTLPTNANIYGLGEHTNPFRLPTDNTTLTLWSRDSYGVPTGTNLYGNHPVYFEHRTTGTHGVFLLNSNGMDIKINNTGPRGTSLEYNVIGGILDFYFLAGSESDPTEVARQYAEVAGLPAEVPYWSFGFHQCRYGYQDFVDVANVISRHESAGIPLETMWTDIDYMYKRRIFTVDPQYFPLNRMRQIIDYLHSHQQRFVLMTDPAVPYLPDQGYSPYDEGKKLNVWLKGPDGKESLGIVWPGVTVYPDWFHPNISQYWTSEFEKFYNPTTGLDIDGAWIDMNEPANFCNLPCDDIFQQAIEQNMPPPNTSPPPDPNTPIFGDQAQNLVSQHKMHDGILNPSRYWTSEFQCFDEPPKGLNIDGTWMDMNETSNFCHPWDDPFQQAIEQNVPPPRTSPPHNPNTLIFVNQNQKYDDILNPPYAINNAAGALSSKTSFTNAKHANGLTEYDAHNLFGTMMSTETHNAMLARRPGKRTLIITRSTFAGAGSHVGKWLGDNYSLWEHYRFSIAGMLGFASVYQVPMVGSDICGFAMDTTETLCARWAMLGAFYPFMRNHNADASISQEFYLWPSVTQAAKNALDIRYRLLDYIYTAFHQAHTDGTPVLHPLWFKYPKDPSTYPIDLQFFFGDSILVSPVTQENATSVSIYLPKDTFYDFRTLAPVQGTGSNITLDNVPFTQIPLHIKGGVVLPLRAKSAMTTTALRKEDFEFIVAPGMDGKATGKLYVDDGESVDPETCTNVWMRFGDADGKLDVGGSFEYKLGVKVSRVRFLGVGSKPEKVLLNGYPVDGSNVGYDAGNKVLDVVIGRPFDGGFTVQYS